MGVSTWTSFTGWSPKRLGNLINLLDDDHESIRCFGIKLQVVKFVFAAAIV